MKPRWWCSNACSERPVLVPSIRAKALPATSPILSREHHFIDAVGSTYGRVFFRVLISDSFSSKKVIPCSRKLALDFFFSF